MSLDDLEEQAREKGISGRAHQELQRVLDMVADKERSYVMWHRTFMFTAAMALWAVMFACVLFLVGLDIELALPAGMGIFLAAVLAVTFFPFLISMFKSLELAQELASIEARAYAIIETKSA